MNTLSDKRIVLGITGGIAAYKAAELVRLLRRQQAEVRVVMTEAALAFITPLTLQALSGNPVHTSLLDPEAEAGMGHIELAKWADAIVIAPASADFIARLNCGMANDLLSTICLATTAAVAVAPAMNQAMWRHRQTQHNIASLQQKGIAAFGPGQGEQACGDTGPGRMLEADQLAAEIALMFGTGRLAGKHVVITAGPTREALDPVRYISNHSSGKMGFALARAAAAEGAAVTLLAGPVYLDTPNGVKRVDVVSADDMLQCALDHAATADVFIGCAAVADYRPADVSGQKIKKSDDTISLTLRKNPDIIASVAQLDNKPFMVGFAAETEKLHQHASEKLERKNLDMIIANDVSSADSGFNSDNNAASVLTRHSDCIDIPACSKIAMAQQIIHLIAGQITGG